VKLNLCATELESFLNCHGIQCKIVLRVLLRFLQRHSPWRSTIVHFDQHLLRVLSGDIVFKAAHLGLQARRFYLVFCISGIKLWALHRWCTHHFGFLQLINFNWL
jgi:hypothetical protein